MRCKRCNTIMIASKRVEEEHAGELILERLFQTWECPVCSVEVIVITPFLTPEGLNDATAIVHL
jgi:hypothetical protein